MLRAARSLGVECQSTAARLRRASSMPTQAGGVGDRPAARSNERSSSASVPASRPRWGGVGQASLSRSCHLRAGDVRPSLACEETWKCSLRRHRAHSWRMRKENEVSRPASTTRAFMVLEGSALIVWSGNACVTRRPSEWRKRPHGRPAWAHARVMGTPENPRCYRYRRSAFRIFASWRGIVCALGRPPGAQAAAGTCGEATAAETSTPGALAPQRLLGCRRRGDTWGRVDAPRWLRASE